MEEQPLSVSAKLETLTAHFSPHNVIDSAQTTYEYETFSASVLSCEELKQLAPHSLMSKLATNDQLKDMHPNLAKLATIGLVLPMSTADCERGFSALSRIKTDLRNRLSCKILNPLMTIAIEGPEPDNFPYERTCEIWARKRNRRIAFSVDI